MLTRGHFSQFTDKQIADPHKVAQALLSFSRDSRDHVDQTVGAGVAAGGREPRPAQDHGFMYGRSLEDPDGNGLEFLHMEPQATEQGPEAYVAEHGAGPDLVPGR